MDNRKIGISALSLALACVLSPQASAGLFDAIIQNVAKDTLNKTVNSATSQAVTAVTQPSADLSGLVVQNGCYSGLPPAPASLPNLNPDANRNGCVDKDEAAAYMLAVSQANGDKSGNGLLGSLAGSAAQQAMAGHGAGIPMTGTAAGWVAGQNAIGAALSAHNNAAPATTSQAPATTSMAMNSQPAASGEFARGDVLKCKIGGVKLLSDAAPDATVLGSLSKGDEVVYEGMETNGFLRVQTGNGNGWVNKLMFSKN